MAGSRRTCIHVPGVKERCENVDGRGRTTRSAVSCDGLRAVSAWPHAVKPVRRDPCIGGLLALGVGLQSIEFFWLRLPANAALSGLERVKR